MKRVVPITILALALGAITAPLASANIGDDPTYGGKGFKVSVMVNVTSDSGKIVQTGSRTISVPARCWWKQARAFDYESTDISSPEAFAKYVAENPLQGHAGAGNLSRPSNDEIIRVNAESKAGKAYRWYWVECADGLNALDEGYTTLGGTFMGQRIGMSFRAFLPGEVPEPLIAVENLADVLWDEAQKQIVAPTLDRNPKAANAGGAAVVNLPNWFWVTNPDESLADDGVLRLTASVPGTPVNMTLEATTGDVDISSVAGSNSCSVPRAKYSFGQGKSDDNACIVTFNQANAGWPVTATVNWTANWQGVDSAGAHEGTATLARSTTINVPVTEIQVQNR
ncbi:hypothetical protein OG474_24530 [Kribbella sp. NBC_01505]|uniref:hypothetical protein n=1 Tax=Kribbella sp. NBC_01505 TaxID=2903580 RepID=UPI003870BB6B